MKKILLLLINMLLLSFNMKAQFQVIGSSGSYETQTSVDNIGIGNFGGGSPAAALDIDGSLLNTQTGEVFKTNAPSGNDSRWQMFRNGSRYGCLYNKTGENHFRLQAPNASGDVIIETGGGTGAGTERFRVASGGNTSIGNVSAFTAQSLLHLNAATTGSVYSQYTNASTTGNGSASSGFRVGIDGTSGDAELRNEYASPMKFYTGGTERMRITGVNGNVCIGTTSTLATIGIGGNQTHSILVERNTTTHGSDFTIRAGAGSNSTINRDFIYLTENATFSVKFPTY